VLKGLGMTVIAHDLFVKTAPTGLNEIRLKSKTEVINESDILSFHLPLTELTKDYVDYELLSQCKKGAIIINTSRGKIINSNALIEWIESGHVYGACLDVIENEKIEAWTEDQSDVYNRLIYHPRVVMTPHIAGWTQESLYKIAKVLLDKITHFQSKIASNQ
jgi:D-3-phosphoglycerate dehydrogenase